MKLLKGFAIVFLTVLLVLIFTQSIFFADKPYEQNVDALLMSPGAQYWFGTDSLGRDLFWKIFAGAKVSLLVGLICPLLILFFGSFYGFFAGWYGGRTDKVLMRICDLFLALPSFLVISILAFVGYISLPSDWGLLKSIAILVVGITCTHWMLLAKVSRAQVLEFRSRPFVEAAQALGGSPLHIASNHILPNIKRTLVAMACLQIPTAIMYESFMSFIGLGVQPPQTSWGILIKEGWQSLSTFPHLILIPSAVLFLTIWSIHILVDAHLKVR